MVATPQVAIQPEGQSGFYAGVVSAAHLGNVASNLPRSRIAFSPKIANQSKIAIAGCNRHSLGKHPNSGWILLRAAIAADDVIVEDRLNIPPLGLRHLREVSAAVQALLFACD